MNPFFRMPPPSWSFVRTRESFTQSKAQRIRCPDEKRDRSDYDPLGNRSRPWCSPDKFLQWMGGFCDLNWSVNPHWKPNFKPRKHPIWNGVQPFSVDDEWYYHMRFVEDRTGFTPILTDVPPMETLRRPMEYAAAIQRYARQWQTGRANMSPGPMNGQKVDGVLDLPADIIMSAGRMIIIERLCSMRFFGPPAWKFPRAGAFIRSG